MVGVAQLVEPWIVIPVVVGSNPIVHPIFGPLAQLVEQVTLNHLVEGSSPSRPTNYNSCLLYFPKSPALPDSFPVTGNEGLVEGFL